MHTPHWRLTYVMWRSFNSNNFVTLAALAEVWALPSLILVVSMQIQKLTTLQRVCILPNTLKRSPVTLTT